MAGDRRRHLAWRSVEVDGRVTAYGVAGDGPPVVFLHGWALAHRTYKRALELLVAGGLRVYAPALPGFAGTSPLPAREFTLGGYARWVESFITAVEISEPVTLVGHSFGGGVAIKTAHDVPDLVGRLVLVNSIGGSTWLDDGNQQRLMSERSVWDWGVHLRADTFSLRQLTRVVPVIAADAVPNLLRQPRVVWRVGHLARSADLAGELDALRERRLPVVILWGREDSVLPLASFESLRVALGDPTVHLLEGSHSWLLANPGRFAELVTNVIGIAAAPAA